MTRDDALNFGFDVATPVVVFLLVVAISLLGLALLREISR